MVKVVKICGLKTTEGCVEALEAGADLLGMIMVPGRARTVDMDVARDMVRLVKGKRSANLARFQSVSQLLEYRNKLKFEDFNEFSQVSSDLIRENGPFIVGVFRNQPLDQVFAMATDLELDFIQLHGNEDKMLFFAANAELKFGIIPRYVVPKDIQLMKQQFEQFHKLHGFGLPLLDSEAGGEGKVIDWSVLEQLGFGNFILAGGLTPSNLHETKHLPNLVGYDVSGGVEDDSGNKDSDKIKLFVAIGKSL
jgi:phosphoribosylanthranilate isomerase